ncbi:hypothetical protein [Pseudaminobacter sp. NGMCC 1.201702]|uniref:hypothetical protein n=1 Tax=Pseudaminobacter sp. NGMCC 1.201702 TaxID=3391825 RepID=UPI0039EEA93E
MRYFLPADKKGFIVRKRQHANKPSGRYIGRVTAYEIFSLNIPTTSLWSATVIFVDDCGIEHQTGYEHPRYPRDVSDPLVSSAVRDLVQDEIDEIAADFADYLTDTGNRFELTHSDWWAPGIKDQLPFFAFEDEPDECLAA